MNKRLAGEIKEFLYRGEATPFSLGTLAVVLLCVVLLIVATFTKIDIVHFWLINKGSGLVSGTKAYQFLGGGGGVGDGGGVGYVKSYFFGYILGFFAAIIFSGRILSGRYTVKNMFFAAVIGVLSIHFCGILYSVILSIFNSSHYSPNFHLIFTNIAYDIVFSLFAIIIAKPLKYILWIAMKNEKNRLREKDV